MSQIWRLASSAPGMPGFASSGFAVGRGRSERNASVWPSGDQRGFSSATAELVSRRGSPPIAGTSQTSVL